MPSLYLLHMDEHTYQVIVVLVANCCLEEEALTVIASTE